MKHHPRITYGLDSYGNTHFIIDNNPRIVFCTSADWCRISGAEVLQAEIDNLELTIIKTEIDL